MTHIAARIMCTPGPPPHTRKSCSSSIILCPRPSSAGTGTVAIYQGVPGNLASVSLSTLTTDTGLPAGHLPLFDQELVSKGIPAESEADAQRIVTELQVRADECQTLFPPAGCPGSLSNEPVEDAP